LGGNKAMLAELNLPDISSALNLQDLSCKSSGEDLMVSAYPVYDWHGDSS